MVKMKIQLLAESVKNTNESQPVKEIMDLVSQTIASARTLTFDISPPVLYELGFESAVEWLLRNARNQHGLSTDFVTDDQKKALDENVSVFLFQAVRELLANVAKHAKAENVTVSVSRFNQHIRVCVADDGIGFEKQKAETLRKKTCGFGLFSIRERLSYIGGKLSINSKLGEGAEIVITAPLAFGKKIAGDKTK
jgi:signal transduction histidine kinase